MADTYYDQFFIIDPANPPGFGTILTPQVFAIVDVNEDGLIDGPSGDSIDGSDVTAVWQGDQIRVRIDGVTLWIEGTTFYLADGRAVFTPNDGTILETASFRTASYVTQDTNMPVGELGPPCLTRGTRVQTARGPVPVEGLCPGDLIETLDHGMQPLLWLGQTRVDASAEHAPIRFARGAIGNDEALLVSPQHRMFIGGWEAQLYYGADEVLVAAKHLVNGTTIRPEPKPTETYFHLLFARHEIIKAGGVWSESYLPDSGLSRHERDLRAALKDRYPSVAEALRAAPLARPQVRRFEAALLAA
ncbi:Hint domain-containing protein [Maritalea mobilis]|uniref:Hint domain-containing protein n=1 Tax=Maritalea mobilis TaxID=483324 RepID=UPI001C948C6B|nr:Hint domain-containing protein [Maritalea mobilis]MBY6201523.1 Hint domain-containing protein [Maritalea mobilis]